MNWIKSHRRLLGIVVTMVLVIGVCGFALTRGYLMRFVVDDMTISREAYLDNAYAPADEQIPMYCTSGATVGIVYLWEVRCYTTSAALSAYMDQ